MFIPQHTVPNQKIIKIPNKIIKKKIIFDIDALNWATEKFKGNTLKLWLYFNKFPQNIDLPLSSRDFIQWSNTSDSTYDRAVKELIEVGCLIPTSRKNYYIFVDKPLEQDNNYIEIEDNNTSKKGSQGELKINQILLNNKINFIREATFGTCLFEDTHYPAKFDFFVEDSYLIEFDGIQHFSPQNGYWNMKDENWFEKLQQRDKYKNNWCKENNIPLIRIPYMKLDTLCIEDLKLETTQFRVV